MPNTLVGYLIGALLLIGSAFYIYVQHVQQKELQEQVDLYKDNLKLLSTQLEISQSSYLEQKEKFAKEKEISAGLKAEIAKLKKENADVQKYLDTVSPTELSDRLRRW